MVSWFGGTPPQVIMTPRRRRPQIVVIFMILSQNSASWTQEVLLAGGARREAQRTRRTPYARTPKKLKLQITTRKMDIHTATLMLATLSQYWITKAAAEISAGRVMA